MDGNFDEPHGVGTYMIVGAANPQTLALWEYQLTLARMVVMGRPMMPHGASFAEAAAIDHMVEVRLGCCQGLIVVIEKTDGDPFVSLNDYRLIMRALMEGKQVLTTVPLHDKSWPKVEFPFSSLDPTAASTLYHFSWDDYKRMFGPQPVKHPKANANTKGATNSQDAPELLTETAH
jgi:hypothetical protein